jgi:phosphoglycerate dehydrogenase-like enzyme
MAEGEVNVLMTVSFPEALIERLRAVSPRLQIRSAPARNSEDLPAAALQEAEVLYTARLLPDPEQVPELRFERYAPQMLRGSTIGIVGYGSVGRELARICRPLGATVLATKRDLKSPDDDDYMQAGMGDPHAEFPDRLYPPEAIGSMLAKCDFVVITIPLTSKTRGLINAKVLKRMQPSAFLIDVSRGGVVDHGALVEALNDNAISGAVLDVFPVEPLPDSSPLWEMPNVLISPHVAGASTAYFQQAAELFAENLRRYLAEQPLLNRYDPERGY